MLFLFCIQLAFISAVGLQKQPEQERDERKIVHELFRLRNEHKADSAELIFCGYRIGIYEIFKKRSKENNYTE